jgi:hypothetical protein
VEIVVEPYPNMKIAQTREWIVQTWFRCGYDKILMLDDDLSFATRISANDWHLREIHGEELIPEFQRIEDKNWLASCGWTQAFLSPGQRFIFNSNADDGVSSKPAVSTNWGGGFGRSFLFAR